MTTSVWERLPPLVVVTGKGGVGKTIVSCTLGRVCAAAGRRVLLLELDPRESLHRFLGCAPSGGAVIQVAPNLDAQNLRPRDVVDRLIGERVKPAWIARRVQSSAIYEQFVQGAPGLREVAALGYARRAGRGGLGLETSYDLVLLDAPATGHGVSLLRAPRLLAEAIRGGPVAELASEAAAMVDDSEASALWAVSTAEGMALRETLELDESLRASLGRGLDLLILNRLLPTGARQAAARRKWLVPWLRRAEFQQAQVASLAERWERPIVSLPLSGQEGPAAVAELADSMLMAVSE